LMFASDVTMKAWIHSLFLALCLFVGFDVKAEGFTTIATAPAAVLSPEQEAVMDWINIQSHYKLDQSVVVKIVRSVYAHANRQRIPASRILGIMRVESRFNPKATSRQGAKGLMQVLARVHKDKLKGRSPFDPDTSVEVGTTIYRDYLEASSGNEHKALMRYVGGGTTKYATDVRKAERDLNKYVIRRLFDSGPNTPDTVLALNG